MGKLLFISVITLILFSCNKQQPIKQEPVKKQQVEVKKEVAGKTNEELFPTKEFDRKQFPIAGIWSPASEDDGTYIFQIDGTFQYYNNYDKKYQKEPIKKGTYKLLETMDIELTVDGKTETHKIKKLGSFATIGETGTYFPPEGVSLKTDKPGISDPIKLLKMCNEINDGNVGKIYPYLTSKSILQLASVGIITKLQLERYKDYSGNIKDIFENYKEIKTVEKKSEDDTNISFDVTYIDKGIESKTVMTIPKENGSYKCSAFDKISLDYSSKKAKNIEFKFFKDLKDLLKASKDSKKSMITLALFDDNEAENINRENSLIQLNDKIISVKIMKEDKTNFLTIEGNYKLKYNTPYEAYIEIDGKINEKPSSLEIFKLVMKGENIQLFYNQQIFEFVKQVTKTKDNE